MRFNYASLSSRAAVCAVAVMAMAALGSPSTYDDMAALRPSGGSDTFWDTSAHAAVAIDVADSSSAGLDSRVPQPAAAATPLQSFDSRWRTKERSAGGNLNTCTPGTLLYFR